MKKIYYFTIAIILMGITSVLCLLLLSCLTYWMKWQANIASIGITLTYILTGFVGGICLKWFPRWRNRKKEEVVQEQQLSYGIGQKMLEAVFAGGVFMLVLLVLSFFLKGSEFGLSERAVVIWLLLSGSACLGRML